MQSQISHICADIFEKSGFTREAEFQARGWRGSRKYNPSCHPGWPAEF